MGVPKDAGASGISMGRWGHTTRAIVIRSEARGDHGSGGREAEETPVDHS